MDKYEKLEKLGQGGQGKVYKVRRRRDDKLFVLKTIKCADDVYLKRAQVEVDVMQGVNHRHVVRLEESFEYKGSNSLYLCIVMEYCPGSDLYQLFRKAKKGLIPAFTEAEQTRWICQIASALQHLHERDLWHRDIKSGNIMFDSSGDLKLGDFGLSATYNIKGHNTVVGTPYYYAPEVMLGERYSNKVDIWNLGVTVLELLTLKMQPINAEILHDKSGAGVMLGSKTARKIASIVAEKGYSSKFGVLLCGMLSRRADDRPSAREILQQLATDGSGGTEHLLSGEKGSGACADLRARLSSLPLFQSYPQKRARHKQKHPHPTEDASSSSLPRASDPHDDDSPGSPGHRARAVARRPMPPAAADAGRRPAGFGAFSPHTPGSPTSPRYSPTYGVHHHHAGSPASPASPTFHRPLAVARG
eukprot:Rhum_TRINITY_DN15630_c0_g1::Rhum_TRINITY_DN15630_c0_g1_i1::g.161724::m.161724/K08857/NEK1_4_5; NIMA (never in mitosis gene a)-related kinase 1/4/5